MLSGAPLAWHFAAPDVWSALKPEDRKGLIDSDLCILRDEHYFIHGLLELPVVDGEGPFVWGVWVTLSKANFDRTCDVWEDANRATEFEGCGPNTSLGNLPDPRSGDAGPKSRQLHHHNW